MNSEVQLAPNQTGKKVRMFENVVGGQTVEAMVITAIDPAGYTNSFVQVAPDSTGKKVQYFQNTISGNVVLAEALVAVNSSGVLI